MDAKDENCLHDLFVVDPQDDMEKIEAKKEPLLDRPYRRILDTKEYAAFTNWSPIGKDGSGGPPCRLLWVKGHAGTGKTMSLVGIIRELTSQSDKGAPKVSHFFCQGTDRGLNTAMAILRSLVWGFLVQQPHLIHHLAWKHKSALFHGDGAFATLADAFKSMLYSPDIPPVYFIIDALDECEQGLAELVKLITTSIAISDKVKWLVSSSPEVELNNPSFAETLFHLDAAQRLERPVNAYIEQKLSILKLKGKHGYDEKTLAEISNEFFQRAVQNFLWVALVFKELEKVWGWHAVDIVRKTPSDLSDLYDHMMIRIERETMNVQHCKNVLVATSLAYRSLSVSELGVLAGLRPEIDTRMIVEKCGLFMTTKEDTVHLIHQSAKDYLKRNYTSRLQHAGVTRGHADISRCSIDAMSSILKQNIHNLSFGFKPENLIPPDRDPLAPIRYSCIYWVEHLCLSGERPEGKVELIDDKQVYEFLKEHFLHWLESLPLLGKLSDGALAIEKLLNIFQKLDTNHQLVRFLKDAESFVSSHGSIIERAPLQTYGSALVFTPTTNEVKRTQWKERLPFIKMVAGLNDDWGTRQPTLASQTLEGYSDSIGTIVFSPDGTTLASAPLEGDCKVQLWDGRTGTHRQTLRGHSGPIRAIAFSIDGTTLASASCDKTIRLWDAKTGVNWQTLKGHSGWVGNIVFSMDNKMLASGSTDHTVRLWDTKTDAHRQTLEGHRGPIKDVAFSPDSTMLASASQDHTVQLWDSKTGVLRQTLEGHSGSVRAIAFSPDNRTLASASSDKTVRLWDTKTGTHRQTINTPSTTKNLKFSKNGQNLITNHGTIKLPPELTSSPDKYPVVKSHSDHTLLVENEWLTTLSKKHLLWLPKVYKATCVAQFGESLVLGHASGELTFFEFEFEEEEE